MKTTTLPQASLTTYPFGKSKLVHQGPNDQSLLSFPEFTTPTIMTEQEIAPPMHVWERIANVLDEQDKQKHLLNQKQTFPTQKRRSPRRLLYAAMTVTAIAGIVATFVRE